MKNGLWKKITACALAAVLCMAPVTETGAFSVAEESVVETAKGEKSFTNATVALEYTTTTYDGTEKKPEVRSVILQDGTELKSTDYSVVYSNFVDASENTTEGKATVTITGTGDYAGQETKVDYTISRADIRSAVTVTVQFLENDAYYVYDGNPKTPRFTVWFNKTEMVYGKDFTYTSSDWAENVHGGQASITLTGLGNFTGTKSFPFRVEKATWSTNLRSTEAYAKYGTNGLTGTSTDDLTYGRVNISRLISETGVTGEITAVEGDKEVLNGSPKVEIVDADGDKVRWLCFAFKNDEQYAGRYVTLNIPVSGPDYDNYNIRVKLNVGPSHEQRVVFEDVTDGVVDKTYGDADFTFPATVTTDDDTTDIGTISYDSSNTDVATVTAEGKVHIKGAGETRITANVTETEKYRSASNYYTLVVGKRTVSILGLSAADKVYDTTDKATVTGTARFSNLATGDNFTPITGYAKFSDADAGVGKTVTFYDYALTEGMSDNYILSGQPASTTATISKAPGLEAQAFDYTLPRFSNKLSFALTEDNEVELPEKPGTLSYTVGTISVLEGNVEVTNAAVEADTLTLDLSNGKRDDQFSVPVTISSTNYEDFLVTVTVLLQTTTEPRSIADATVTVSGNYVYTGASQIPETSNVTVTLGEDILDPSLDYTTEVKNNLNAGTATVTVTGRDDAGYKDSATGTFDIQRREIAISGATVKTRPYEAQKKTMEISAVDFVEANDSTQAVSLGNGSDYTAKGSVQSDTAGEKAVTVTVTIRNKNYLLNESTTTVTGEITKIDRETASLERITRYGTGAQIPLTPYIEAGGSVGTISISGNDEIFDGMSITGASTAGKENILTYQLKDDEKYNKETATLSVPIIGATNYNDYTIEVKVTVNDCLHLHTTTVDDEGASCTKEGYTGNIKCMDCGQIISTGEPIPALGHAYSSYIRRPMTPFVDGIRTYVCDRCGDTYSELIEAEEDEDAYDDLYTDAKVNGAASMTSVTVITDDDGAITSVTTVKIDEEPVSVITTDETTGESSESSRIWIGGLEESYIYNGSAIKPEVRVYDGVNQLTPKKDYTVSYSNNKNATKEAAVKIKFKGSYQGTEDAIAYFTIEPAVLGRDVEFTDVSVVENGKFQNPKPGALWVSSGKAISSSQFSVAYFTDDGLISLEDGLLEAGTYKAHVIGATENFRETGEATVSVVEKIESSAQLSKATVTMSPKKYSYTGSAIVPAEKIGYQLKIKGQLLVEGEDYERTAVYNNVNPGTATVVFTAIDKNKKGLVGSKTATFKIVGGKSLDSSGISVSYNNAVIYEKGGVGTTIKIRDNGTLLKEGTDYTVKYTKNKKATSGNTAVATITGKGKYKKSIRRLYAIERQDISELSVQVEDKLQSKSGYTNPKVTITDLNGKKLDKKDYTLSGYTKPDPNGLVQVTITGTGSYKGTRTVSYRYITKAMQLSKVKANKIDSQEYTGGEVYLSKQALTNVLYTGSKSLPDYLTPGEDFTVSSYSNNTKKGTARVTLKGIGNYGGTKTVSFTITQKQGEFLGALIGGSWDTK